MAFFTLLTKTGLAKHANALALGQELQITHMALGDGAGNPTAPNENQEELVREVYRAQINQLSLDPANQNYVIAELVVPSEVGGWTVRELALYDVDGDLIAVGNFPETYKPQLTEGASRDLVVRMVTAFSNASIVQLKIDPSVVLASRSWVSAQFLLRSKVAGGLAGQVLTKGSNADEDFDWVDPTAAVEVIVDVKSERQTLAADQTIVNWAQIKAQGSAVYVEGLRLIETMDFTVTGEAQITLATAYPAGSTIHGYQNESLDTIQGATEAARGLVRLATTEQAQTLADDSAALTPKKLADAFKGVNLNLLTNGYQKFPGGLIFQWLTITLPPTPAGNRADVNATFPIAFPNACFGVTHSVGIPVADYDQPTGIGTYRLDRQEASFGRPTKEGVEGSVFYDNSIGDARGITLFAIGY